MPIQMINVGNLANDGTGDDLREAFIKINQNFQIEPRGTNLGTSGADVFAGIVDGEFQFKRLVPGTNINIESLENTVVISSPETGTDFLIMGDNSSTCEITNGIVLNLSGGVGIDTEVDNNTKTVSISLAEPILSYTDFDFGKIDAVQSSIFEFVMNTIGVNLGSFVNPSTLSIDQGTFI